MNITFILGNGFDIQLGLRSRYSDFLKEYIKIAPQDNDNIKKFKSYLSKKTSQELWSNAEAAMGMYLKGYSDKTIEVYNEQVQDFEVHLINYLKQQQERCSFSDSEKIASHFKSFLFKSFGDVLTARRDKLNTDKGTNNIYNFISFNYTDLLEKIKKCCSSITLRTRSDATAKYFDNWGSIFHVHGTLDRQIIMGVNDESQLDISGGITLTDELRWELIKPTLNFESGNSFDRPAKNAILKSDIIAIYGVSYGDTDKLWWETIVNWLKQSPEHRLVAFVRDEPEQFIPALAWTELKYERSRRKDILKKLHIEENTPDFENLVGQIYIILNTTRLDLKELLISQSDGEDAIAASTNQDKPIAI